MSIESDEFWKTYDKVLKETGMMISPARKCNISFNKIQRMCKNHVIIVTEFGKKCICDIAEDPKRENCNMINCPLLKGESFDEAHQD